MLILPYSSLFFTKSLQLYWKSLLLTLPEDKTTPITISITLSPPLQTIVYLYPFLCHSVSASVSGNVNFISLSGG